MSGEGSRSESSTAKLRIWTLRIWGFRGPGFRFARHVLCGTRHTLFSIIFLSIYAMSWGGPPKKPKSSATETTTWHCSNVLPCPWRKKSKHINGIPKKAGRIPRSSWDSPVNILFRYVFFSTFLFCFLALS